MELSTSPELERQNTNINPRKPLIQEGLGKSGEMVCDKPSVNTARATILKFQQNLQKPELNETVENVQPTRLTLSRRNVQGNSINHIKSPENSIAQGDLRSKIIHGRRITQAYEQDSNLLSTIGVDQNSAQISRLSLRNSQLNEHNKYIRPTTVLQRPTISLKRPSSARFDANDQITLQDVSLRRDEPTFDIQTYIRSRNRPRAVHGFKNFSFTQSELLDIPRMSQIQIPSEKPIILHQGAQNYTDFGLQNPRLKAQDKNIHASIATDTNNKQIQINHKIAGNSQNTVTNKFVPVPRKRTIFSQNVISISIRRSNNPQDYVEALLGTITSHFQKQLIDFHPHSKKS